MVRLYDLLPLVIRLRDKEASSGGVEPILERITEALLQGQFDEYAELLVGLNAIRDALRADHPYRGLLLRLVGQSVSEGWEESLEKFFLSEAIPWHRISGTRLGWKKALQYRTAGAYAVHELFKSQLREYDDYSPLRDDAHSIRAARIGITPAGLSPYEVSGDTITRVAPVIPVDPGVWEPYDAEDWKGGGIIPPGSAGNGSTEIQAFSVQATSGSYRLTFHGAQTGAIDFDADELAVQSALEALPSIGEDNVLVFGYSHPTEDDPTPLRFYFVIFAGALAGKDVARVELASTSIAADKIAGPYVVHQGGQQLFNEFQLVDLDGATHGWFRFTYQAETSAQIDYEQDANVADLKALVKTRIEEFEAIPAGSIKVWGTNGFWLIEFAGPLSNINVHPLGIVGELHGGVYPGIVIISPGEGDPPGEPGEGESRPPAVIEGGETRFDAREHRAIGQGFGYDVHVWGDWAFMGTFWGDQVHVYRKTPLESDPTQKYWRYFTRILPTGPTAGIDSGFGRRIRVSGNTGNAVTATHNPGTGADDGNVYVAINAPQDRWDANGENEIVDAGAVWVYRLDSDNVFRFHRKVVCPERATNPFGVKIEEFGKNFDFKGGKLAVGCPNRAGSEGPNVGAVYVWKLVGGNFVPISDPGGRLSMAQAPFSKAGARFGESVGINHFWLNVGAPGMITTAGGWRGGGVFFYTYSTVIGGPTENTYGDGAVTYAFGETTRRRGERLATNMSGYVAYSYEQGSEASGWRTQATVSTVNATFTLIRPPEYSGGWPQGFGKALHLAPTFIELMVGSPNEEIDGKPNVGAAYRFEFAYSGHLQLIERIVPSGPNSIIRDSYFGSSVATVKWEEDYLVGAYGSPFNRYGLNELSHAGAAWGLVTDPPPEDPDDPDEPPPPPPEDPETDLSPIVGDRYAIFPVGEFPYVGTVDDTSEGVTIEPDTTQAFPVVAPAGLIDDPFVLIIIRVRGYSNDGTLRGWLSFNGNDDRKVFFNDVDGNKTHELKWYGFWDDFPWDDVYVSLSAIDAPVTIRGMEFVVVQPLPPQTITVPISGSALQPADNDTGTRLQRENDAQAANVLMYGETAIGCWNRYIDPRNPGQGRRIWTYHGFARFQNVPVPPYALIDAASVRFTPYPESYHNPELGTPDGEGPLVCVISAHDTSNSPPIRNLNDIAGFDQRRRTQVRVRWEGVNWTHEGNAESAYSRRSPDIANVVRQVVRKPEWKTNNAILLFFSGERTATDLTRSVGVATGYQNSPNFGPRLEITYRVAATPGGTGRRTVHGGPLTGGEDGVAPGQGTIFEPGVETLIDGCATACETFCQSGPETGGTCLTTCESDCQTVAEQTGNSEDFSIPPGQDQSPSLQYELETTIERNACFGNVLRYTDAMALLNEYLRDQRPIHVLPIYCLTTFDFPEVGSRGRDGVVVGVLGKFNERGPRTADNLEIDPTCTQGCMVNCESFCEVGCESNCQGIGACETSCQLHCENTCQSDCEVVCQAGCVLSCEDSCQSYCQSECESACENVCEDACQGACEVAGCQLSCTSGCEDSCEHDCQHSCEFDCQSANELQCASSCQEFCEQCCETDCEDAGCQSAEEDPGCQDSCEANCEAGCESGSCEAGCEYACERSCEADCQTACEDSSCETNCETNCQQACEGSCQAACENNCQFGCQGGGCEASCEGGCQGGCETSCEYTCEGASCQAACESSGCQSCCECQCQSNSCESGCTSSCTSGCQTSCESSCQAYGGCETGCQASCEGSAESCANCCEVCCENYTEYGCGFGSCESSCEVSCESACQGVCQTSCESSCQSVCENVSCETVCQTPCESTCQSAGESDGSCQFVCQSIMEQVIV